MREREASSYTSMVFRVKEKELPEKRVIEEDCVAKVPWDGKKEDIITMIIISFFLFPEKK